MVNVHCLEETTKRKRHKRRHRVKRNQTKPLPAANGHHVTPRDRDVIGGHVTRRDRDVSGELEPRDTTTDASPDVFIASVQQQQLQLQLQHDFAPELQDTDMSLELELRDTTTNALPAHDVFIDSVQQQQLLLLQQLQLQQHDFAPELQDTDTSLELELRDTTTHALPDVFIDSVQQQQQQCDVVVVGVEAEMSGRISEARNPDIETLGELESDNDSSGIHFRFFLSHRPS